jgi:hypothetical protein
MFGVIATWLAWPTAQLSVTGWLGAMTLAEAVNDEMTGAPLQTAGVEVGVEVAFRTNTVTCALVTLPPQKALSVKVVVSFNATLIKPGVPTPPIFGVISARSALLTSPQLKVTESPRSMSVLEAVNDEMLGIPLQTVGVGAITLILTNSTGPKKEPLSARNCQRPRYVPGTTGASIGTTRSALAPDGVTGMATTGGADIGLSLTNTS